MGCKELDMTERQHTHTRLISEAKAKEEARGQGGLVLFLLLLWLSAPFVPLIQFLPQPHLVLPIPVVYTHPSSLGKDEILKTLGDNQKYY